MPCKPVMRTVEAKCFGGGAAAMTCIFLAEATMGKRPEIIKNGDEVVKVIAAVMLNPLNAEWRPGNLKDWIFKREQNSACNCRQWNHFH